MMGLEWGQRTQWANAYAAGHRNWKMLQNINEIRRANAEAVLQSVFNGDKVAMSDALDTQPSFVGRLVNPNAAQRRNIGDAIARKIEQIAGKPLHWLDHDHSIDRAEVPKQPTELDDIERLMKLSTPRSRNSLQRIAQAAAENRLTEADCELLANIASRIAR